MAIAEETPTSSLVGRRMTLEQFDKLPLVKPYLELIDGVVQQKVAPKPTHGRLQSMFRERFKTAGEDRGLGMAFTETRFTTPTSAPVPDLVFYLCDRVPFGADGSVPEDFSIPPDVAIEIISPDQRVSELIRKCNWYLENGVRVAILVLLDDGAVLMFRPGQQVKTLEGDEPIDLDDVLPGFELTVAELFGFLTPRHPRTRKRSAR